MTDREGAELPKIVAIVGTTASGKSAIGVSLAERFGGEIVSADSRQVYRGMDLGSGKIAPHEMRGVRHWLLDVREPGEFFSMADFQRLAYAAIGDILSRGKLPLLVGGTGLYLSSVTEGYELPAIDPDPALRERLEALETPALYRFLREKLPGTDVDPKNRHRVMRMIERLEGGGAPEEGRRARYRTLKLGVTLKRELLDRRIGERLEARLDSGMVDEVRRLLAQGVSERFLLKLGLEYKLVAQYLGGGFRSLQEMTETLALRIRQFSKRQMTWFRRDGAIVWLDMDKDPLEQAAGLIEAFLGDPGAGCGAPAVRI